MKNIFAKKNNPTHGQPHNVFDLSFQNNLTLPFGKIIPVFCKEVLPTDKFRINATMGFNLMPLAFPIQTRMQAQLSFFYVRNRTLWKDFEDFIYQTKQGLVPPYLKISPSDASSRLATGSLADYLGVPTTNVGSYGSTYIFPTSSFSNFFSPDDISTDFGMLSDVTPLDIVTLILSQQNFNHNGVGSNYPSSSYYSSSNYLSTLMSALRSPSVRFFNSANSSQTLKSALENSSLGANLVISDGPLEPSDLITGVKSSSELTPILHIFKNHFDPSKPPIINDSYFGNQSTLSVGQSSSMLSHASSSSNYLERFGLLVTKVVNDSLLDSTFLDLLGSHDNVPFTLGFNRQQKGKLIFDTLQFFDNDWELIATRLNQLIDENPDGICLTFVNYGAGFQSDSPSSIFSQLYSPAREVYSDFNLYRTPVVEPGSDPALPVTGFIFGATLVFHELESSIHDAVDNNPFVEYDSSTGSAVKLSSLPFRAYEMIYNSFYRDQRNDPFVLNGVNEYNKFLTTDAGGADSTFYSLFSKNWEPDFLTSATQSPQQGVAPLVGITYSDNSQGATFHFVDENDQEYTAGVNVEDGRLSGIDVHSPDMPSGTLRALQDVINHGISINDFRNVNALQRWLERNISAGYRYRDLIEAHFGKAPRFDAVDMPEFIGGHTEPVVVNKITQTVDVSAESPLASYAGQASIFGSSKHSISCYCDEHGFIIGLLTIVPTPNYSQLLPKHFLKNNPLDYYDPLFGKIGNQPIDYREVCPISAYREGLITGDDELNKVFGYQRPWYDYLASVDEVHAQFRTILHNFVMHRTFDVKPELGGDFLHIDPNQLNDVFAVTDDTDKILGQVYFDCKVSRAIPRYSVPALE